MNKTLPILLVWLPCFAPAAQAQFDYATNADGVTLTLTGYEGPGGDETIPSATNGLTIDNIGDYAFAYCHSLTSITIPGSVTNIGNYAFSDCVNLAGVTNTTGLVTIGEDAFVHCVSLAGINIPATVTNIGAGAFDGCYDLTAITAEAGSLFYSSAGGVLFDAAQMTLLAYPGGLGGSYAVPGTVTNIADFSFYMDTNLAGVTIPDGVTNIGSYAFAGCGGLTGVTLPATVTNIGTGVFDDCQHLGAIAVEAGNTFYSSAGGVLFDAAQMTLLAYPGGLGGSYAVPGSVTNIADDAFYDCAGLTGITIPAGVTNIGNSAFYGCSNLTGVAIPGSVTNIGTYAFAYCARLADVTIPSSVTNIGTYAFAYCASLTNVTLTDAVIHFTAGAASTDSVVFYGDKSATAYYLPGAAGWGNSFAGIPAVLWNPVIRTDDGGFGVRNNHFGFNITGTNNFAVVVKACPDLANPVWVSLTNATLTNGSYYFSDPQAADLPGRYYNLSLP
jgi:hypothetical protein